MAVQPDGRIIVGHNGVIARIDTFGAQDTSFAHGATICGLAGRFIVTSACDVYTIVVEPGGNILAGGFGSIIRLNPAGLVDSNFVLTAISYGFHGVTFPGRINKLLLQPDGRIVVFGAFNLINGESMRSPIRLNTDSSIERSFRSDGFWATDGALLPEGKLLANGLSSLARLHSDGSLDEDFANAGTDGEIRAVAVLEDQRILIGGRFSYVAGESHRALARLNANGSLDTNFNPVVVLDNAGGIVAVQALTAGRKGHLFLAGSFADGSTRVLKLDSEGRVISVFNSGLQFNTAQGFPGAINSIIEEPNGEVLVAGNFDNVSSIPRPGIARLKGVRSHVHLTAPALQPDGSLRVVTGSQVGSRYVLQGSIDLRSWSNIATGTATACTLELYDPNPASARFYRVQLER